MSKRNALIAVLCLLFTGVLLAACGGNNAAEQARADSLMRDSLAKGSIRKDGIADSVRKAHVKPYRKWATFNKDTLAYLKYNFYDRRDFYIRKPFIILYNDLELKIKRLVPASTDPTSSTVDYGYFRFVMDDDLGIFFYKKAPLKKLSNRLLIISFKQLHPEGVDDQVFKLYGERWNSYQLEIYRNLTVTQIDMMESALDTLAARGL